MRRKNNQDPAAPPSEAAPGPAAKPVRSFPLRLEAATMEQLERWAADEFRSVNGQLQWIIADALRRYRK